MFDLVPVLPDDWVLLTHCTFYFDIFKINQLPARNLYNKKSYRGQENMDRLLLVMGVIESFVIRLFIRTMNNIMYGWIIKTIDNYLNNQYYWIIIRLIICTDKQSIPLNNSCIFLEIQEFCISKQQNYCFFLHDDIIVRKKKKMETKLVGYRWLVVSS